MYFAEVDTFDPFTAQRRSYWRTRTRLACPHNELYDLVSCYLSARHLFRKLQDIVGVAEHSTSLSQECKQGCEVLEATRSVDRHCQAASGSS